MPAPPSDSISLRRETPVEAQASDLRSGAVTDSAPAASSGPVPSTGPVEDPGTGSLPLHDDSPVGASGSATGVTALGGHSAYSGEVHADMRGHGQIPEEQRTEQVPQAPATTHPRRPRSIIVLSALLAVLALACGYLLFLCIKWSDFGDATHAANYDLGKQLAATETALDSARTSLDNTRSQLTTAQERISELAKEKALVGDDREEQRLIAEDTTAVATEALAVSRDLGKCVEVQSKYVNALSDYTQAQRRLTTQLALDPEAGDTAAVSDAQDDIKTASTTLTGLEDSLNDTCTEAVDRHNKLVEDLQE